MKPRAEVTAENIVFVLGAGFTKAFLPDAPLLVDDYGGKSLRETFAPFPAALTLLELERLREGDDRLNIERLMTRIDGGGMPYDSDSSQDELRLLLAELKRRFVDRINRAKASAPRSEDLRDFARYCVEHRVTIITFNHDDVLDEAMWSVRRVHRIESASGPYWHPDGGYGFFCRPSENCVGDRPVVMDLESVLLLKLHGSVNWRPRRGARRPYVVDAIVHHEDWRPVEHEYLTNVAAIPLHLEPEPFIVPPVLIKTTLVEQPILRLVWSLARKALGDATRVIFVGYSMPRTDIAAAFLFTEALSNLAPRNIELVNLADSASEQATVRAAYREVFPQLSDGQFDFRGALDWARRLGKREPEENSAAPNRSAGFP